MSHGSNVRSGSPLKPDKPGKAASAAPDSHVSAEEWQRRAEGWMRHAQTSDTEVAWLRKALGVTSTEESCALRDLLAREEEPRPISARKGDLLNMTLHAVRGANGLEEVWREHAQMWERRCDEATWKTLR